MKQELTYYQKHFLAIRRKLTPIPQNNEEATFAANIKREQEKIDWTKTGEEIYNHIRGFNPWPVAFTTLEWSSLKNMAGREGYWSKREMCLEQLSKYESDGFTVSTGNETAIKITELQPSGKTKMTSEQFLQRCRIKILLGTRLGEST